MTTPDVPHRFEITLEVPGTPEQVWAAIATANGISSWMMRTDLDEREGGTVCFHMGETDSVGEVTGWDPPRRFAYIEPDWAGLVEQDGALVTPLATEFLVEAKSGGTCVIRVVSSAFGTGADWENEFFEDMAKGWTPLFDVLRLYLTHFPGQQVTLLGVEALVAGTPEAALSTVRAAFGADQVGQTVEARGLTGYVERISEWNVLLRLSTPVPGFLTIWAGPMKDEALVGLSGWLFSDDAAEYVEREQPGWKAWLDSLDLEDASAVSR